VEKRILRYDEYRSGNLNEGLLDSVMRFFKGIFDLFGDRKVKKESEEISNYFKKMSDDDTLSDDELEDDIDTKRVRRSNEKFTEYIVDRVEVDTEKAIMTNKGLMKSFSSWIAMIVAQQESLKLDFIQKMLANNALQKRFTFVPDEHREDLEKWYKDPKCILDPKVKTALLKVANAEPAMRQKAIEEFAKNFVGYVAEKNYEKGLTKLKSNDKEFIQDVYSGLAAMTLGITRGMKTMVKNTPDDKIANMVSSTLIEERSRKKSKDKKEEPSAEEETNDELAGRARKSKKNSKPLSGGDTAKAEVDKSPTAKVEDKSLKTN
jgi:O6-methylguanine-DNA--protein-cysteine methyltransferase